MSTFEIQRRMSEVRSELNRRIEPADEEQRKLTSELDTLETKFREALDEERAAEEPETREFKALADKIELRAYIQSAIRGNQIDGREAEVNAHLGLDSDCVPLEALEERADTVAPTEVGRSQRVITPLFGRSVAAFLGCTFPRPGMGEASYAVMSDDIDPTVKAAAAAADEDNPTFSTTELKPGRLTTTVIWRVEDAAVFPIESNLRTVMRESMEDALDTRVLQGAAVASTWNQGLVPELTIDPAAKDGAATSNTDILERIVTAVDGLYANSAGQLRILVRPNVYAGWIEKPYVTMGDATSLYDKIAQYVGEIRVTAKLEAVATDERVLIMKGRHSDRSMICPVWNGIRLIRDELSTATTGRIRLTALMLANLYVGDESAFKLTRYRIS